MKKIKSFASYFQPNVNKPPVKDHKKEEKSYELLYKDKWRDVISKTKFMKIYVFITTILKHMIFESEIIIKCKNIKMISIFYHDAL